MPKTNHYNEFNKMVVAQINLQLDHFFNPKSDHRNALDTSEQVLQVAQAGLLLTGLGSAPFTFGLGLATAGTLIILLKAGKVTFDALQDPDHSVTQLPEDFYENQHHLQRLAFFLVLRQAAQLIAIRYHYSLNQETELEGVEAFAQHVARRLLNKLTKELINNPQTLPQPETLMNHLLSNIKLDLLHYETITLKTEPCRSQLARAVLTKKIPAKQFAALQRWICFDDNDVKILASEQSFFQQNSTHKRLYITIEASAKDTLKLAIDHDHLKELALSTKEKTDLINKSLFPHLVSRQEVLDFLNTNKLKSLNEYLTQTYHRPIIACCHDDRLKAIDFNKGNFSSVNFYGTDLSDCNFSDANFNSANLVRTKLWNIKTNKQTSFQNASMEGSQWREVIVQGNYCNTKLVGSTFIDCTFSKHILQIESEWDYVTLQNPQMDEDFEKKMQESLDQRQAIAERIQRIQTDFNELNTSSKIEALAVHKSIRLLQSEVSQLREQFQRSSSSDSSQSEDSSNSLKVIHKFEERTPSHNVLTRVMHHWMTEINTEDYRLKKASFIPLHIGFEHESPQENMLLNDFIDFFLESDKSVLIIHGESGCGKDFSILRYFEKLMSEHINGNSWGPLHLDVSKVTNHDGNILASSLETIFIKTQLDELQNYPWLIRLGKMDVSRIPIEKAIKDFEAFTQNWPKKVKLIITIKTNYMLQEVKLDQILNQSNAYLVCHIKPLVEYQIHNFFQCYRKKNLLELCRSYQQSGILDIEKLASNPLMLTILASVLLQQSTIASPPPNFRSYFYREFWRSWYNRVRYQLPENYQSYQDFMALMYKIARAIHKKNNQSITYKLNYTSATGRRPPFYELLETKMTALSPFSIIKKNDNEYEVRPIHPSVIYHLIAEVLLDSLFEPDFLSSTTKKIWNSNYLIQTPEIFDFLVELIQEYPEKLGRHVETNKVSSSSSESDYSSDSSHTTLYRDKITIESRLMVLIELTRLHSTHKKREDYTKASSNAFTLLVSKWRRSAQGKNFANLLLPHADASFGLLPDTRFENTDISESNFYKTMLLRANFRGAKFTHTKFLSAPKFIEIGSYPRTFLVYPSLNESILLYPTENQGMQYITMIKINNEDIQLLRFWPAHAAEVTGMVLAQDLLATADQMGTTKIWRMHAEENPTEIAAFIDIPSQSAIDFLAFGPNDRLLATGGNDGHIRIWDIETKQRIFKSFGLGMPIRALIWGKNSDRLFMTTDNHKLYQWNHSQTDERTLSKYPVHSINKKPIKGLHSLALTPDETKCAIGTEHGEIFIFDIAQQTLRGIPGHQDRVTSLNWFDTLISSSRDQTIRIWTDHTISILQQDHPIGKIDVLPHCGQIISGIDPVCSRFYFWENSQNISKSTDMNKRISCMAPSPNTKKPIVAIGDVSGAVTLYPLQDMDQPGIPAPAHVLVHEQASVRMLAWSLEGHYLASLGEDQSVLIKNIMHETQPVTILKPQENLLFTTLTWIMDFAKNNSLLIGDNQGNIHIFQEKDEFKFATIVTQQAGPIQCIASTFAHTQIAVSSPTQLNIMTYHADGVPNILEENISHPYSESTSHLLMWSPDGRYLLSADKNHCYYIWSIQDNALSILIQYQAEEIKSLLWSDQWLILGNSKEMLYWDLSTTESMHREPKRIHLGSCFMSSMGDQLLFAKDNGVFFFDKKYLENGQPVQVNRLKSEFLAEDMDITNSQGLSSSTQFFLEKNGVKSDEPFIDRAIRSRNNSLHNLPLLPPVASPLEMMSMFNPKSTLPRSSFLEGNRQEPSAAFIEI